MVNSEYITEATNTLKDIFSDSLDNDDDNMAELTLHVVQDMRNGEDNGDTIISQNVCKKNKFHELVR